MLINKEYVKGCLNHVAHWAESHGSDHEEYLGAGLFYYSLVYMLKARFCVCIGSGGGFVPRIMRQAQRDLALEGARTILIDADEGPYGRPFWLPEDSYFRTSFPDVELIFGRSHDVALGEGAGWKIDYLHIDGDHSHEGSRQDFFDYKPLMAPGGVITFHDTQGFQLPCRCTLDDIRADGHDVVEFPDAGAGFAVVKLRTSA